MVKNTRNIYRFDFKELENLGADVLISAATGRHSISGKRIQANSVRNKDEVSGFMKRRCLRHERVQSYL